MAQLEGRSSRRGSKNTQALSGTSASMVIVPSRSKAV
jgi:hypothetical protein